MLHSKRDVKVTKLIFQYSWLKCYLLSNILFWWFIGSIYIGFLSMLWPLQFSPLLECQFWWWGCQQPQSLPHYKPFWTIFSRSMEICHSLLLLFFLLYHNKCKVLDVHSMQNLTIFNIESNVIFCPTFVCRPKTETEAKLASESYSHLGMRKRRLHALSNKWRYSNDFQLTGN